MNELDTFLRSGTEPYMQVDRMKLRNYFPHEIKELSVLQVNKTRTFDEIGHTIEGGLYDPLLGPLSEFDKCETCAQYAKHCPGHMGHIELVVPAFNPILFSFTFNLLKGSCVQCHRMTCNTDSMAAKVLLAQLRCFELGVPEIANDIEFEFRDKIKEMFDGSELTADPLKKDAHMKMMIAELDKMISTKSNLSPGSLGPGAPTKNAVDLRRTVVNEFLRKHLYNRKQRCPLCKGKNGTLTNDGTRCVIINFTSKSKSKNKKTAFLNDIEHGDFDLEESADEDDKDVDLGDMERCGYGGMEVSAGSLQQQMEAVRRGTCDKLAWRGAEIREHFREVWRTDGAFLLKLFPMLDDEGAKGRCPLDGLFSELILVPPTKFRPIRRMKGQNYEDPQTVNLRRVLETNETIKAISLVMSGDNSSSLTELISNRVKGKTINAKMHNAYLALQQCVNCIFDEDLDKQTDAKQKTPGIKQILEKKQGLFRMNMMGKRVNFACRSVITPDPYLDIDEIGIPEIFAKKLTFSEPVNLYNVQHLRQLVSNGSAKHPGANAVIKRMKKEIIGDVSNPESKAKAEALMKTLEPPNTDTSEVTDDSAAARVPLGAPMKVLRHMRKGDMMMMNRQPSLHKPSILGHRARILTGQRALRMNYAPCKAYNADFDGDEMNGHLVQSHIAQCEVAEIASVGHNLLVPKDATPLLGLIQDHVVSGVLLTLRGRFLNKEDFMHLVLAAFAEQSDRIEIPPPAMIKPQTLWSGKQVITCIMKNCIPAGMPLINLSGKAKTPLSCWKVRGYPAPKFEMSESEVIFRQGELLVGVLDKAHYGATQYGLGHCCFELYGPKVGVKVLSCFSRLFTTYLQFHGFTLGVADILVRKDANDERKAAVRESRTIGDQVVRSTFGLDDNCSAADIKRVLASTYCSPRGQGQDVKMLDFGMKQGVAKYNDAIIKACVPEGLIRSFPENALQMMIQSGAKGSAVNAIQISCNLGQIELEGKRMAVTIAGRTLPSFRAFDPSPRAGGYIDQRFLTGINPQELYFHTMAGREGLIDTAVKTSRSGYLQRCIIKHLEGIKVHYDSTVRDHDGSIIQFRYGEDGLDTCKSSFFGPKTYGFLEDNLETVMMSAKPQEARDRDFKVDETKAHYKTIVKWRKRAPTKKIFKSAFINFADEYIGTPKERLQELWKEHIAEKTIGLDLDDSKKVLKEYFDDALDRCPKTVDEAYKLTRDLGALPEKTLDDIAKVTGKGKDIFRSALLWKGMKCLADPGENVGLLAAQSIGEPSTQMTLNTFHFAGRGEMNVTLGIPRLREILMTASKNIATPSAMIAVIPGTPRERIDLVKQELDRVYMKQVLRKFTVEDRINVVVGENWRRYHIRFEILEESKREQGAKHMKRRDIMDALESRFIRVVAKTLESKLRLAADFQQIMSKKLRSGNMVAGINDDSHNRTSRRGPVDDGASSDEEADGGKEADASEKKLSSRHNDEAADYEGEDEDQRALGNQDELEEDDDEEDVKPDIGDEEGEADEPAGEADSAKKPTKALTRENIDSRIRHVIQLSDAICGYSFDTKDESWGEVVFQLPLSTKTKLDLETILAREVESFIIHQTPGIERCVETTQNKNGVDVLYIQTQGVNLQALFRHADVLDVNTVYSNDLNLVLNQYGVEACARGIVTEMNNVFAVYGIEVSRRHLSLTADYMTFTGVIQPFNRGAMASASSPLQKMTFETTIAFLRDSLLHGEEDMMNSPSARLVLGSLNRGGTGAFDLLMDLDYSE